MDILEFYQKLYKKESGTTIPCHSSAKVENLIQIKDLEYWKKSATKLIMEEGTFEVTVTFTEYNRMTFTPYKLSMVVNDIMRHTRNVNNFVMIPDVSEKGMYHLHGVVKVNELLAVNNLKRKLSKLCGRTQIKPITYRESYCKYCFKIYIGDKPQPFYNKLAFEKY